MILDLFNSDFFIFIAAVLILLIGLGVVIFGITSWKKRGSKIKERLERYVAREEIAPQKPVRRILLRETSGSLFKRTIGNWSTALLEFFGRFTPQKAIERLEHQLNIAGNPGGMDAIQFNMVRYLLLFVGLFLAFLVVSDFSSLSLTEIAMAVLVVLVSYMLPTTWLNSKMRARQSEIQRGLPDALDMLSVCASAGMGFDQSLQKITDYWETELGRELKRAIHEMEMGVPRGTALMNMSNRLRVDDLTNFITIIVQAEKIGMSYADVLHSQAQQMRIMRQYRAKEIANRLPAKMIIPLALFIFPAIVIVILAPAVPSLLSIF